ncbi:glucose-fructose oxidoreductase [Alteromonas halophila]|uniref:Glucose-fructose oxidoreductase n=2 Tax=Alteromonas halophila TaxID=516698 RepID=A0A918JF70_9ALTE|nr:glucose-fructose oxidoreductase [Alteromonas halophila]
MALPALPLAARNDKKLGVALLGLGNYASNLLAPALTHTRHCELRGIITGSPEKIPRWQKKYGIADANVYTYDSMSSLADNPDIDVVYVVTPTATHRRFAVNAAQTGKHVWCEKPMAMDTGECQQIIDACEANRVRLSIGYRMLHEPNTRRFAGYASTRPYGPMQSLQSFAGYAGNGLPADNWRMRPEMGGGALYDMGVYAINGARFVTQREPVSVTATFEKSHPDIFRHVDETTLFSLDFGDGLIADCGTSVVRGFNRLKVTCDDGWYALKPMQSYSGVAGRTSDDRRFPAIRGMQQTLQMDNDALAIMGRGPSLVSPEEGLRDIHLVSKIFAAAKSGKQVAV